MDTTIIENTQVINVFQNLNGVGGSFDLSINIDFIPDMMIVKTIQYDNKLADELGLTSIYTNIINNQIASFIESTTSNPNTRFLIYNKPIRGTYNFKILDSTGLVNAGRQGDLFMQLEFVKYKKVSEQKLY